MITKLIYNWHQTGDSDSGFGEDYDVAEVGCLDTRSRLQVKSITEHKAAGEGDKWYYDIFFIDDTEMRVFNPNRVIRTTDKSIF